MQDNPQLTEQQLKFIKTILKHYIPDETVWLFGSRVTGKAKAHSDVDLVIDSKQILPQLTMAKLNDAFAESDFPYKVDILDWSMLTDVFKQLIRQKYLVIQ